MGLATASTTSRLTIETCAKLLLFSIAPRSCGRDDGILDGLARAIVFPYELEWAMVEQHHLPLQFHAPAAWGDFPPFVAVQLGYDSWLAAGVFQDLQGLGGDISKREPLNRMAGICSKCTSNCVGLAATATCMAGVANIWLYACRSPGQFKCARFIACALAFLDRMLHS